MSTDRRVPDITLRPWSDPDLPLLERLLGNPAMTVHLGGPESPEQIRKRHARYLALPHAGDDRMLVILAGPDAASAGSIGYWHKAWRGETVWETGWSVLPEFQGQGIATGAIAAVLDELRATGGPRSVHAFPSVDNAPSNAICRKAGFTLLDAMEFEYPPGQVMRCNDWSLNLRDEDWDDQNVG